MSEENKLPPGWVEARLEDVTLPGTSRNPKGEGEGEFLYVDIEALDNTSQQITVPKLLPKTQAPSRARLDIRSGDVIFSLVRPYLKNVAVVPIELDGQIASTAYCVLRPAPEIESKYIFYAVLREQFINSIVTYGDSPPAGHDDEFLAMSIPLAPTKEQQGIAAAIEEQFTCLDAGIAALKAAQIRLKHYRAAVLKAAVEGKLTEEWRSVHPYVEPAEVLLKRILGVRRARWEAELQAKGKDPTKARYEEPTAPETTNLPELMEGWCWSSLGQCFEVHVGATPSRKELSYWGGDIPWVSSGEVQFCRIKETGEHITQAGLENSSTQINPAGSVLLGMIGEGRTRGQVAILDIAACNNQNCAAIWVSQTSIPSEYIYYWLWSQYELTRTRGSGNNQPALNKTRVENIPFPLPPIDELAVIVAEIEQRLSVVSILETIIDNNLKRAERLRQSILTEAFAGRLVPQDSNDEPASVLLERIRKEREHNNGKKQRNGNELPFSHPRLEERPSQLHAEQVSLWED